MTKTDTSREAVSEAAKAITVYPHRGPYTADLLRALLTERDALQARAERAEAGLHKAKARIFDLSSRGYGLRVRLLDYLNSRTMSKNELRKSFDEWESADGPRFVVIENPIAQLDAEPAGVSEPAGVRVKPLEWWVSDTGDRIADTIIGRYQIQNVTGNANCRLFAPGYEIKNGLEYWPEEAAKATAQADYEQRILTALEPGQTHREGWEQAKEAAAIVARNACLVPPDGGSPTEAEVAVCDEAERRIRAMPYPGDSQ